MFLRKRPVHRGGQRGREDFEVGRARGTCRCGSCALALGPTSAPTELGWLRGAAGKPPVRAQEGLELERPGDRALVVSRRGWQRSSQVAARYAARRRRAFCTEGSAAFALANGRALRSTLAGLAAISISSPVAGLRPWRFF